MFSLIITSNNQSYCVISEEEKAQREADGCCPVRGSCGERVRGRWTGATVSGSEETEEKSS